VHGDGLQERGLGPRSQGFVRRDNLAAASRSFGLLGLAGTIVLLLVAEWINPGWLGRADWRSWILRLVFYLGSASAQALVVVGFLLVRVSSVVAGAAPGRGLTSGQRLVAAAVTATIFAALHAPDPLVVGLTATFGFASAWICLGTPNVLPAALCQAGLGLLVHRGLELTLRVGYFHSHPGAYVFREAFPAIRTMIGNLW
jgi:hypothetical protein